MVKAKDSKSFGFARASSNPARVVVFCLLGTALSLFFAISNNFLALFKLNSIQFNHYKFKYSFRMMQERKKNVGFYLP